METAIIVALIGLGGVLFAIFANHRLQLWQERRRVLRVVATTYRAAFADEVLAFRHDTVTLHTLTDGFERHQAAVTTALPLLGWLDRFRVKRAWNRYCGKYDNHQEISLKIFIQGYSHQDFMQQGRQRFLAVSSALDHLAT